jgi:iron complex outermembrane receptor protein
MVGVSPCNRELHIQWIAPTNTSTWNNIELLILPKKSKIVSTKNEIIHLRNLCSDSVEIEITTANYHGHHWVKTGVRQLCILSVTDSLTQHTLTGSPFTITYSTLDNNPKLHRELDQEIHERMQTVFIDVEKLEDNTDFKLDARTMHLQSNGLFSDKIESLPMVNVLKSGLGSAKPVVQGLMGLRVPIIKNGIRLEGQAWGLDHSPELDGWNIQTVELLDAVQSLVFSPDAWGKSISANGNIPLHSGLAFNDYTQLLGVNSNGGGIQASGKWNFSKKETTVQQLTWNARKQGNYATPTYRTANTGLEEFSAAYLRHFQGHRVEKTLRLDAYCFQSGILLNSHVGSLSDLQSAIQRTEPLFQPHFNYAINKPKQVSGQWLGSFETKRTPKPKVTTINRWSLQGNIRQEYDPHRVASRTFAQLSILQATARYQFIQTIGNSNYGTMHELQGQDYGGYFFVPSYLQWRSAAFFSQSAKVLSVKKKLTWAIRADVLARNVTIPSIGGLVGLQPSVQQVYFAPTGAIRYENNHTQLPWNIELSHIWRQPGVNELYASGVHHGTASYEIGNPQLKPETGEKLELGWRIKPMGLWLSGFSVLSTNTIHVFPQSEPVITVRGAFPAYRFEQLPSYYGGLHIHHQMRSNNHSWLWENTAEFVYSKILGTQSNAFSHPALLPAPFGKSTLTYQTHHASFTLETKAVRRQLWYDARYDLLPPPRGYVVMNVRFTLNNFLGTQQTLVIYGENLTNQRYRDYLDRFRYFVDQPGTNIGIRWQTNLHKHSEHNHTKKHH